VQSRADVPELPGSVCTGGGGRSEKCLSLQTARFEVREVDTDCGKPVILNALHDDGNPQWDGWEAHCENNALLERGPDPPIQPRIARSRTFRHGVLMSPTE